MSGEKGVAFADISGEADIYKQTQGSLGPFFPSTEDLSRQEVAYSFDLRHQHKPSQATNNTVCHLRQDSLDQKPSFLGRAEQKLTQSSAQLS